MRPRRAHIKSASFKTTPPHSRPGCRTFGFPFRIVVCSRARALAHTRDRRVPFGSVPATPQCIPLCTFPPHNGISYTRILALTHQQLEHSTHTHEPCSRADFSVSYFTPLPTGAFAPTSPTPTKSALRVLEAAAAPEYWTFHLHTLALRTHAQFGERYRSRMCLVCRPASIPVAAAIARNRTRTKIALALCQHSLGAPRRTASDRDDAAARDSASSAIRCVSSVDPTCSNAQHAKAPPRPAAAARPVRPIAPASQSVSSARQSRVKLPHRILPNKKKTDKRGSTVELRSSITKSTSN